MPSKDRDLRTLRPTADYPSDVPHPVLDAVQLVHFEKTGSTAGQFVNIPACRQYDAEMFLSLFYELRG